jgi:hypothetical protein
LFAVDIQKNPVLWARYRRLLHGNCDPDFQAATDPLRTWGNPTQTRVSNINGRMIYMRIDINAAAPADRRHWSA